MLDPRSLLPPGKDETERVDELLELLRLTRVEKAPVAALPLGVSRLVEVGRALASEPNVLLLDEPLSGLDIKASENLLTVFRQIVDQPGHAGRLAVDPAHSGGEVGRSVRQAVLEELSVTTDRGEWGPQLVGGIGHETSQPFL